MQRVWDWIGLSLVANRRWAWGGGCNLTLQVQVFGDLEAGTVSTLLGHWGLTLGSARHTSGGKAWEQSRSRQLELVEAL